MQQEWAALPKDVNRTTYLKRINEIIKGLKTQNGSIKSILVDIKEIQDSTTDQMKMIRAVDAEVEELVFRDAQKDKVAKDIYKEIQTLKGDYDTLITGVQEKNRLKSQMKEIENKIEDFRIKYKGMQEVNRLKLELEQVTFENSQLQQMLVK